MLACLLLTFQRHREIHHQQDIYMSTLTVGLSKLNEVSESEEVALDAMERKTCLSLFESVRLRI
jgi:hypothetical protein